MNTLRIASVTVIAAAIVATSALPASAASERNANSQAGQLQPCQVWVEDQSPSTATRMTIDNCLLQASVWGASRNADFGLGEWGSARFSINRKGQVFNWDGSQWAFFANMNDSDGDGMRYDACPQQKEVYNKIFDTDGCADSIETLVDLTAKDLNRFWEKTFQTLEWRYTPVTIVRSYSAQTAIETRCGPSAPDNAFYCRKDHGIYYDADFVQRQMFVEGHGDFSAAVIVAHEWGHAIQAQLPKELVERGMQRELQADCFSGVYAKYLDAGEGLIKLDPGDLEEGAHQFFMIGDDSPWFDPHSHGTPEQRVQSFLGGLEYGMPACFPE